MATAGAEEADKVDETMYKQTTKTIQKKPKENVEEGNEQQLPKGATVDHQSETEIFRNV